MTKRKIASKKQVVVILLALTFLIGCVNFTQQALPPDAQSACGPSPEVINDGEFNSWFDNPPASKDGAVKPANSRTFIDAILNGGGLAPGSDCNFYKWSEQMFLWLTSPTPPRYGGGGGLIMGSNSFYDVTPADPNDGSRNFIPHQSGMFRTFNLRSSQHGAHDLPIVMEKNTARILEVLKPVTSPNGKQLILNKAGDEIEIGNVRPGANQQPIFVDVSGKVIEGARAIIRSKSDTAHNAKSTRFDRMVDLDKSNLVQKVMMNKAPVFVGINGEIINVEQGQGGDGDVLMSQNGSLVYYAITVNEVFAYYRTMQGAGFTGGSGLKFPVTTAQLNAITSFAANAPVPFKKTLIDPDAMAVEIKSAWVEAAGLPNLNRFITMQGTIPTYDKTTDPNHWTPNGQKTVLLALVGIHIVGSTGSQNSLNTNGGHPEMLWATFEHASNEPCPSYTYAKASGNGTMPDNSNAGAWVFCATNPTGTFNQAHMKLDAAGTGIIPVGGNTMSASNTKRMMPFGMPVSSAVSNSNLITINNSVRNRLTALGDIRANYIQVGTTWTVFGASPNGGNQVGTNKLANMTMETYQPNSNCFSCHSSNTTDVSFIFQPLKPLF